MCEGYPLKIAQTHVLTFVQTCVTMQVAHLPCVERAEKASALVVGAFVIFLGIFDIHLPIPSFCWDIRHSMR